MTAVLLVTLEITWVVMGEGDIFVYIGVEESKPSLTCNRICLYFNLWPLHLSFPSSMDAGGYSLCRTVLKRNTSIDREEIPMTTNVT